MEHDNEKPAPARVLLAKVGLDGHDRGIKIVARLLRQHGHEVVYLGRRRQPSTVVRAAVEEDVDVLGLSVLSGTHHSVIEEIFAEIDRQGADVKLIVGGTIRRPEIPGLLERGVSAVFPTGTPLQEITDWFGSVPGGHQWK